MERNDDPYIDYIWFSNICQISSLAIYADASFKSFEILLITEENHAHFQLPIASTASDGAGVADGGASESTIFTKETLEELRELHRDGVGATSVGLRHLVHWMIFLFWHPRGWWKLYRRSDFCVQIGGFCFHLLVAAQMVNEGNTPSPPCLRCY